MSASHIEKSQQFFATFYAFILQIQGLHWNITGQHFFQIHDFFEDVYNDLIPDIDALAERIRFFGAYPPSTLSSLSAHSQIEDCVSDTFDAGKMIDLFLKSAHKIKSQGQGMLCIYEDDPVSQDYYVSILSKLDTHIWKAHMYQS